MLESKAIKGATRWRGWMKGAMRDVMKDASNNTMKDALKGATQGAMRYVMKDASNNTMKDALKGAASGAMKDAPNNAMKDALKGAMKGAMKNVIKDAPKGAINSAMTGTIRDTARRTASVLLVAALATGGLMASGQAWAESDAVKELAAPPAIQLPLKPSPEFAKFPRYAGMLGKRQIVLRLGPKTDDPSGVHGEYQYTDTGEVILIAGDRDGDTLEVEESNDGTHITGNWVGKFAADGSVAGDRMNVDDSDPQPFDLHPLAAGQAVPAPGAPAQEPAAASATPASSAGQAGQAAQAASGTGAPGGARPVNGVNNLTTGE